MDDASVETDHLDPEFAPLVEVVNGQDVLGAAVSVLGDGKPRKAAEILADALRRKLVKPSTTAQRIDSVLTQHIARATLRGNRPLVVESTTGHEFRINHPADNWPSIALPSRPRYVSRHDVEAISTRLRSTGTGSDPIAFELAVCDAFTMLGFVAQHVGGYNEPDGTLDAPLGPLAYRTILECKSAPASGVVGLPRPEEPAKFRDSYHADFAVIVGPAFSDNVSLLNELDTHRVSAWTTDDLLAAIGNDVDTYECRSLFAPGFVHDALGDLVWSRTHGKDKRLAILRDLLRREGYDEQRRLVGRMRASDMPVLTLDAATILVATALQKAGIDAAPTRAELQQAMDDLIRADEAATVEGREGIIIRRGGIGARLS
jgi:hypothetical protein